MVALAITVGVFAVDATLRSLEDDPGRRLGFLDRTRPVLVATQSTATALDDLLDTLATLDPTAARLRVDRIVEAASRQRDEVAALDPPVTLRPAVALLLSALHLRADAVGEIRALIEDLARPAANGPGFDSFVTRLVAVGDDLALADRLVARFLDQAARAVPEGEVVALDAVPWLDEIGALDVNAAGALLTAVRSAGVLAETRDLAVIAVSIDPPAVVRDGTDVGEPISVLATDAPLDVTVIVANRGSRAEQGVTVRVRVETGGGEPVEESEVVDLDPGGQAAVRLGGFRPAADGMTILVVRVDPVDDEPLADNERVLRLRVRAPDEAISTTTTSAPPTTTTTGPG